MMRKAADMGLDLCSRSRECDRELMVCPAALMMDSSAHIKLSPEEGSDLLTVWVAPLTSGQVGYVKT